MKVPKKVKYNFTKKEKMWVGDGFHVHPMLRPTPDLVDAISPFILMDYAAPREFSPSRRPKGVGQHPHRGFETVTFAYQGEVEHRDSSGGGGVIKQGGVQWMTAGRGVVHDEFHSQDFTKEGGIFEMVQLWVNLPREHKMTDPKYQGVQSDDIPVSYLGDNSQVNLRLIAGSFAEQVGACTTFSPINIYDLSSREVADLSLSFSEGSNTIFLILKGGISVNDKSYREKEIVIFEQEGTLVDFTLLAESKVLVLNGKPLNEPVVAHGPFVMNSQQEIVQAIQDYQNGHMGAL